MWIERGQNIGHEEIGVKTRMKRCDEFSLACFDTRLIHIYVLKL